MLDAELAVVVRQGRVYGLFGRTDADRVARWLRTYGNGDVRVTVASIESWGPIPHDGARRVEVRNALGAAPFLVAWTLNDSLTGPPQWERREDGRLVETETTRRLRVLTDIWIEQGIRVAQYGSA